MTETRIVILPDGHQDTETLINGVWAITYCSLGEVNPPIYATELDPDCEISDADPGL